ncbi:RteC domain-containing protein [Salegentibacter sp. JZCK2]|uniref:RteC domain-containing protein n=1 Tax=Salegentibacter tibetensis TaxID=2873600 RepID=UPI001CCB256B|nr:RteC domain-containing protein [Salegentibacter tibetensis]MBZ9730761.1 RteC domain-containing protein [Salegentibacter tibetensis]
MFEKAMSTFSENVERLIQSGKTDLKKADDGISLCIKTLLKLQKQVDKEDFDDTQSEIEFFRNIKPLPMSYLIYFTEVRSCELLLPKAGNSHKVRFLEKEIKKINKFFSANNSFVNYMEQNHNYLDHEFFSRKGRRDFSFSPSINYYQNPEFSTSHDMLWAKVQALYRFIHYIREKLELIQPGSSGDFRERQPNLLLWSGSKISLVEIIYALYHQGDINHGTADLKTIVSAFEDFFNIKIDNFYKTYGEMRARKDPRAKYLYQIATNLEAKMRKDDEK